MGGVRHKALNGNGVVEVQFAPYSAAMDKSPDLLRTDDGHVDGDMTRRHLLKTPAMGALIASASGAPKLKQSPVDGVDISQFGAKGDGRVDDTEAFRAALAAAQIVAIPPGSYRITKPLRLRDGQSIRGAGRAGWEPYIGNGPPASSVRTEILLEAGLAFDARGTNNAMIAGVAIRAKDARQSEWGTEPGFQPGTTGIDITGALQFDASALSLHGLEVGIHSVADSGRSTQMPRIANWVAHDCGTVFQFISNDRTFYAVRDAQITDCVAALHCGRIAHVRKCDGLRIENVRLFQCKTNSLLIERTPFLAITGATLFETGEEAIVLRDCQYVTMAGVQVARTGFYRSGKLLQRTALLIEDCVDLTFDGLIEQPLGRAVTITGCTNVAIRGAIGTPYWSTGSLWPHEGAVHIERSCATLINASFGGLFYWVAVWADASSAATVAGRITTEGPAGVVRCVQLQSAPLGYVVRTSGQTLVAGGASINLDELRILVPAGKSLVTCSVELTASGVLFAAGPRHWKVEGTPEPGGGSLSLERTLLHRNDSAQPRYAAIPIGLHNPTGAAIMVPAGHEIRLSLAIE